jgi:hypothetical protein
MRIIQIIAAVGNAGLNKDYIYKNNVSLPEEIKRRLNSGNACYH